MNKWQIDTNMYLTQRDDVMPGVKNTLIHRYIGVFDIVTGQIQGHDFLIEEQIYNALKCAGYWNIFCKKLCNDRQRVLYDADFPKDNLALPILQLEIILKVGV